MSRWRRWRATLCAAAALTLSTAVGAQTPAVRAAFDAEGIIVAAMGRAPKT